MNASYFEGKKDLILLNMQLKIVCYIWYTFWSNLSSNTMNMDMWSALMNNNNITIHLANSKCSRNTTSNCLKLLDRIMRRPKGLMDSVISSRFDHKLLDHFSPYFAAVQSFKFYAYLRVNSSINVPLTTRFANSF